MPAPNQYKRQQEIQKALDHYFVSEAIDRANDRRSIWVRLFPNKLPARNGHVLITEGNANRQANRSSQRS